MHAKEGNPEISTRHQASVWEFNIWWNLVLKSSLLEKIWLRQGNWVAYFYRTEPKMWRHRRLCRHGCMPGLWGCVCEDLPVTMHCICKSMHLLFIVCALYLWSFASMPIQCVRTAMSQSNCFIRQWQSVSHFVWRGRQQREDCCIQFFSQQGPLCGDYTATLLSTWRDTVWITELTSTDWKLESDTIWWALRLNTNQLKTLAPTQCVTKTTAARNNQRSDLCMNWTHSVLAGSWSCFWFLKKWQKLGN